VTVEVIAVVRGGKLSMPAQVSLTAPLSAVVTKTVTLKNSGSGMLSGSAQSLGPNSPFTLVGGPISFWLASGATQPLTIQFKPAGPGTVQGNLAIATVEPAGIASISLLGSAK
jgi:hypothetical protein